MAETSGRDDGVGRLPPPRNGLFWTTLVLLALSLVIFATWLAYEIMYEVIRFLIGRVDDFIRFSWLFDAHSQLSDLLTFLPFSVATVVLPVIAVGLFIGWSYVHRDRPGDGSWLSRAARICAGILGLWGWLFATQNVIAYHASIEDYPGVLLHFGLPVGARIPALIVAFAAGTGFLVAAMIRMLRITEPVAAGQDARSMASPVDGGAATDPTATVGENKVCPMCAEEVKAQALICRYCGHDFHAGQRQGKPSGTSGLAIASLVLGLLWLYGIGSLLAVIFGHRAIGQINASGGTQGGKGMAVAGVVLGWFGLASTAIVVLALVSS